MKKTLKIVCLSILLLSMLISVASGVPAQSTDEYNYSEGLPTPFIGTWRQDGFFHIKRLCVSSRWNGSIWEFRESF